MFLVSCNRKIFSLVEEDAKIVFYSKESSTQIIFSTNDSIFIKRILPGGIGKCNGKWKYLNKKTIKINHECQKVDFEGINSLLPQLILESDSINILSRNTISYERLIFKRTEKELGW